MKKCIVLVCLICSLVFTLFASEYVNWASDDRVSKKANEEYFAHKTYPIGSTVRVSVNGAVKDLVVNDRPRDKRSEATVSVSVARELGFFYMGRDEVNTTLIHSLVESDIFDGSSKVKWYNIEGIYPRSTQGLVQLFSILIERGYKAEVNKENKTLTVKYIPEYRLNSELESLKLLSDGGHTPYSVLVDLQ